MSNQGIMDLERQRDEVLAAMQSQAGAEPLPGEMRAGDIVHRGDDDLDAQMVVGKGKGAAILYIWDTRTGERSRTSANMLPTQLSKRRADGSQVFTTRDPGIIPVRGQLKCMLHPDGANRADYDRMGLGICAKSNLPSRQDVKTHMQNRHKREWATIEEERLRIEKEQDRELQRAILEGAAAGAAAQRANEAGEESAPRRGRRATADVA